MSTIQIIVIAVASAVLTIPAVLLIPRARQSRAFDLFLWIATWVIGFLGGWAAIGYSVTPDSGSTPRLLIEDVPLLNIALGTAAGIVFLHVVLFFMDRLAHPGAELDADDVDTNPEGMPSPPEEVDATPTLPQEQPRQDHDST